MVSSNCSWRWRDHCVPVLGTSSTPSYRVQHRRSRCRNCSCCRPSLRRQRSSRIRLRDLPVSGDGSSHSLKDPVRK